MDVKDDAVLKTHTTQTATVSVKEQKDESQAKEYDEQKIDSEEGAPQKLPETSYDPCSGPVACSIEKALDVLGGKWTFLIIRDLFDGTRRFGELRQSLNGVSPKTLSARLRELEKKNVVERTAFATIPPTVQYCLTEKGRSLKPIIKAMKIWGAQWG